MRLLLFSLLVTSTLFGASYYKSLNSNADMYTGAVGFANQLKAAIEQNQLAIDVRESTTYDGNAKCLTSNCSFNDTQSWCSDQWLGYKIYIPAKIAGVSFQFSSTPTRPSGIYTVMASFVPDNATDTERKIDLQGALEYPDLSEGIFGSGISSKALKYDSFSVGLGIYELKYLGYTPQGGGWLYIDISQASIFGDGEPATRTFNLNYSVKFASSADIQEVLDTKYFDKNTLVPVEHTVNVYPQTCSNPSPYQLLGNTDTGVLGNQLDFSSIPTTPPTTTPPPTTTTPPPTTTTTPISGGGDIYIPPTTTTTPTATVDCSNLNPNFPAPPGCTSTSYVTTTSSSSSVVSTTTTMSEAQVACIAIGGTFIDGVCLGGTTNTQPSSSSSVSSSSSYSSSLSSSSSSSAQSSSAAADNTSTARAAINSAFTKTIMTRVINNQPSIEGRFIRYGEGSYDWIYIPYGTTMVYKLNGIDAKANILWEPIQVADEAFSTLTIDNKTVTFGSAIANSYTKESTMAIINILAEKKTLNVDGFFIKYGVASFDWIFTSADGAHGSKLEGVDPSTNLLIWTSIW